MATPNTGIPYVPENTTDPAAGLNLALNVIDALLQTAVLDMDRTEPPESPSDGDLHIVGGGATGAWEGQDDNLARYVAEGDFWQFYTAGAQVKLVLNFADSGLYKFDGSNGWTLAAGISDAPIDGSTYGRKDGAWEVVGGGSGDVVGPGSSTADAVALFDGTTGKLLKDGVTVAQIKQVEQNSQSAAYTLVLADAGKHILHPSADTTARTFTIPANSSVAFPVGTAITFVNQNAAGTVTIAITTDTMRLAGAGTTGSRTLAANGMATALKITSTEWIISGTGLT